MTEAVNAMMIDVIAIVAAVAMAYVSPIVNIAKAPADNAVRTPKRTNPTRKGPPVRRELFMV
jgi:hypothetical protein